ncbi:response regulator [Janthinobacterium svalbardensis]|uniref:Response regulator n=1 Tax=Janthinobacterium svalbardensis TaxID=368607 RepID=A0A290WZ94_9BURK|nr:response regulator [Janthinobacterium svalbardensis]ATD62219.1 response regulator [Janthinobacterium svalbardensis]
MDVHDEHGMPRAAAQPRTLLLVDDEPNILASLKRLLRPDGYHILTANSGQEGLDVLASNAVDVIVSDQRMPGMLGADFLRKAKLLCPQTIRIMLSGYTELQAVTDAVNEGAIFKFLTKPWEDQQLRGHIAEAFRLKGIDDDNVCLNAQLRDANQALAAANAAMQALVSQQQHQISRDEVSLGIAREVLQFLPLPVIGLDDEGMIAFINAAAANLFERGAALLGNEAALVLPQLFDGQDTPRLVAIDGQPYVVAVHPMGLHSRSRGSLVTLSRHGADT